MNGIGEKLDQVVDLLDRLNGLPAIALVLISCLALGYVLRLVRRFPNDAIPLAVILWGMAAMPLLSDFRTSGIQSLRIWLVRNVVLGLVVGFAAWAIHNRLLSAVEDWLATRFPIVKAILFTEGNEENKGSGNGGPGGKMPPAPAGETPAATKPSTTATSTTTPKQ
jgi:hypothetical protein